MTTKKIIIGIIAATISVASCKKQTGPEGPAGSNGAQGPAGPVLSGNLKGFIAHFDLSGIKMTTGLAGDSVLIDGSTQVSVTDANGLYSFTGLTTGIYNLTVKRSGFGIMKIQGAQFTGGGDTYRNANISKIPTTNVTTLVAVDTVVNSVNYIRFRGTLPALGFIQSVIVYVGIPGNNVVNASASNQTSSYTFNVNANVTTFSKLVPTSDFYDLGYASANTAYFAAYLIGGGANASSYTDLTNNKTINTAISSTPVFASATIQ